VPVSYFFEDLNDSKSEAGDDQDCNLAEATAQAFEHERLSSRETLEMMRSYYRISDPLIRKRITDLIRALADPAPDAEDKE